jgi:hypothetical protein
MHAYWPHIYPPNECPPNMKSVKHITFLHYSRNSMKKVSTSVAVLASNLGRLLPPMPIMSGMIT